MPTEYALVNPSPVGRKYGYYSPPYHKGRLYEKNIPFQSVRWKASTVLNKVAYIGNVVAVDKDGKFSRHPDTMFKSAVGSYDLFAPNRMIDVSTDDGEEIQVLASYADRILQFKTNNLYIINTAQGTEYLEDARYNLGVTHPYAVCKTEYGIAWANGYGCYLYDGQQIRTLTEAKGRKKVKITNITSNPTENVVPDWDDVIKENGNDGNVWVGYEPKTKKLIIVGKHGDSANDSGFTFDMASQAWVYHADKLVYPGRLTNPVLTASRKMAYIVQPDISVETCSIYQWNHYRQQATAGNFLIMTKNYDFGDASRRKTIYAVKVTCRHGNNVKVYLSFDGGETKTEVGGLTHGLSHIDTLVTNLPAEDIYTCMVILNNPVSVNEQTMEIYEIDIVYRIKKIKS